ncbi:MAG: hypothetical protein H8D74_01270 [Chloroflexi bacterium]|nr:hypothetical protein [Chloroflexota bacterium]
MAEESLETNLDNQEVVEAEATGVPSKKELSQDDILAMIEQARADAKREARAQAEEAFTRSQSLIDKNIARERQETQSQYTALTERYTQALAEHGAEPATIEGLQRQTRTEMEIQELRQKAQQYDVLRAEREAEQAKEETISQTCAEYNIDRYHKDLDTSSPQALNRSVLAILANRIKRQERDSERDNLKRLTQAGALDVTGGGAAMAPAAWSTAKLVPGSEESIIAGHVMHYFQNLTAAELGQKIQKAQQLMKAEPRLTAKEAARRMRSTEA